jgi:hypothetical protein
MSQDLLQVLLDFRRETPAPDAETTRRIYALATTTGTEPSRSRSVVQGRWRRSLALRAALVGAGAAAVAVLVTLTSLGGGPGVENAVAAVKKAATVTSASADLSGTAVVRITHDGEVWVAKTIRWHGEDLSVSTDEPEWQACAQRFGAARCGKMGSKQLLVDGTMYGIDPKDGGWVNLGSPESIDPDSGTTPGETLAAVREDVGGATLRRITDGMTGLTTSQLDDGSTVYSGSVAAGLIARETGLKEGQAIRVLPFGNVAHGEAANPDALLDAAVTVGADGIVRQITVTWGTWTYSVAYSRLGETPAPVAPENARDLLKERLSGD